MRKHKIFLDQSAYNLEIRIIAHVYHENCLLLSSFLRVRLTIRLRGN